MIMFILAGAFILGLCIFIHELGHYVCGRLVGVKAEIFSIGYGRGIWKKKIGDTTWQITAIPLGGYVKFYGDDFYDPKSREVKGGLLNASPLRRIIPVLGGPLFNLILGLIVFFVIHSISGPISPVVKIIEDVPAASSPAYQSGLRDGDRVLSIDGKPVKSFLDIRKNVVLSSGEPLDFRILREGKEETIKVKPNVVSSGAAYILIREPGERRLEVNYHWQSKWAYYIKSMFGEPTPPKDMRAITALNDGDIILKVEGRDVHSVTGLQEILGENHGRKVELTVRRQTLPWLTPLITHETKTTAQSYAEYKISLTNLVDLKYNESLPPQTLKSSIDEHERALNHMKLEGQPEIGFKSLFDRYSTPAEAVVELRGNKYRATIHAEKIGTLGFLVGDRIEGEYDPREPGIGPIFSGAFESTGENIMLYPLFFKKLFTGRMDFLDNATGPVGMFAAAGHLAKSGLRDYLQWLAMISIALMVMNLLPFPVLDGGHIVFFLYEAIAGRPISPTIMEMTYRFGFVVLMSLGLVVMYKDIVRFVL